MKTNMLAASDAGNDSNKVSYLDEKGNIRSLTLSSVIAPAKSEKPIDLGGDRDKSKLEKILHVHIESQSLPSNNQSGYYYVGEFAKTSLDVIQPGYKDRHGAVITEKKSGNEIHAVTTLTALAIATWEQEKEEVKVSLAVGMPIAEYKETQGEQLRNQYTGTHTVKAIDGLHEGKTVNIHIENVIVYVEGITSYIGFSFDLKDGEVVLTPENQRIGDEFGLADLGAGTLDLAVYNEYGLDSEQSNSLHVGTNKYIDSMLDEIANLDAFAEIRDEIPDEEDRKPFRTREQFIDEVIRPEIIKLVQNPSHELKFEVEWLYMTEPVTDIVLKHMQAYAEEVLLPIKRFRATNRIKRMVLVGGGVLFAYYFLKDEKSFILPSSLEQIAYFTSRGYLLKNFIDSHETAKQ